MIVIPKKGIKCLHLNIHYLHSKLPQVKSLLADLKVPIQILGFSETFLSDKVKDINLHIAGYNLHRKDRAHKQGGGVAVYVADHLNAKRRKDLESAHIESIWLEIRPKKCKPFLVCNLYRPPNSKDDWLTLFETNLTSANGDNKELILMGDFNIDLLSNRNAAH